MELHSLPQYGVCLPCRFVEVTGSPRDGYNVCVRMGGGLSGDFLLQVRLATPDEFAITPVAVRQHIEALMEMSEPLSVFVPTEDCRTVCWHATREQPISGDIFVGTETTAREVLFRSHVLQEVLPPADE